MPKDDDVVMMLSGKSDTFLGNDALGSALGLCARDSVLGSALAHSDFLMNEVNYCPAVQQWAVCTP